MPYSNDMRNMKAIVEGKTPKKAAKIHFPAFSEMCVE
jgi:hypothetical protein